MTKEEIENRVGLSLNAKNAPLTAYIVLEKESKEGDVQKILLVPVHGTTIIEIGGSALHIPTGEHVEKVTKTKQRG